MAIAGEGDVPSSQEEIKPEFDAVTEVQRRLDDMSIMFYTYLGIIQRDAPPSTRPPDEADEIPGDEAAREELRKKIPDFASDIVRTSAEIDAGTRRIANELEADAGDEHNFLAIADAKSTEAGVELAAAADSLTNLLSRVRDAIYEIEQDI